jgi:hypothetical protein
MPAMRRLQSRTLTRRNPRSRPRRPARRGGPPGCRLAERRRARPGPGERRVRLRRAAHPPDPRLKTIQERLIELGYLRGAADGRFGPVTSDAILAFQKWERLGRTGKLDMGTESRLARASRPGPISRGGVGKRAEVIDRQVALLIVNNKVLRTIAVSSGKPSTPTPPGNSKVYAKIPRWWSVPFREWLPWAVPFVGGIAFRDRAVVT